MKGRCTYYLAAAATLHSCKEGATAHFFWSNQNSAYLVVLRAGNHGNKSVPTIKMIVWRRVNPQFWVEYYLQPYGRLAGFFGIILRMA